MRCQCIFNYCVLAIFGSEFLRSFGVQYVSQCDGVWTYGHAMFTPHTINVVMVYVECVGMTEVFIVKAFQCLNWIVFYKSVSYFLYDIYKTFGVESVETMGPWVSEIPWDNSYVTIQKIPKGKGQLTKTSTFLVTKRLRYMKGFE